MANPEDWASFMWLKSFCRWWGRRDCPEFSKSSSDETSELQIENVAGVFFILVGGIVVAAVTCLGEYVAKQISKNIKKVRPYFK